MGVLLNKKTGSYYIRIKHYGRDYEKVIGSDKKLAELALAQVKLEIKKSKLAGQGWDGFEKFSKAVKPRTFGDAAIDYIEERADYKQSTIKAYGYILNQALLPAFGSLPLKEITDSRLRKFQVELGTQKTTGGKVLSQSRINTVMQLMGKKREQVELTVILQKRLEGWMNQKLKLTHLQMRSLTLLCPVLPRTTGHSLPLLLTRVLDQTRCRHCGGLT